MTAINEITEGNFSFMRTNTAYKWSLRTVAMVEKRLNQ